jgi:hypothetical protein
MKSRKLNGNGWLCVIVLGLLIAGGIGRTQLQQSGGPGSAVTVTSGSITANAGTNLNTSNLDVALSTRLKPADTLAGVTTVGAVTAITNALPGGSNLLGYVKQRPNGCTSALTSDVVHDTVAVATGAGTSVSSVTGCVLECYVNNITNSAVTLRIADKAGTPVIWIGGNADFSVPANSNMGCAANGGLMLAGITFTSGITAIAGTASALNLHIVTRE